MCLSLRDGLVVKGGDKNLTIWGPPGLLKVKNAATSTFLKHFGSDVSARFQEIRRDGAVFEDQSIAVEFQGFRPAGNGQPSSAGQSEPLPEGGEGPSKRLRLDPASSTTENAGCYSVVIKPPQRNLDMARVKALGVPLGPVLGDLKDGKSITLASGQKIDPEDVLGPKSEPYRFVIINCSNVGCVTIPPSPSHSPISKCGLLSSQIHRFSLYALDCRGHGGCFPHSDIGGRW